MNYTEEFDIARKAYPGVKRGLKVEFDNFCKKHEDWKEAILLLMPAIEYQISWREKKKRQNKFVPEWKHFKTWINTRWWEAIEEPAPQKPKPDYEKINRDRIRKEYQSYFESKSTKALLDIKKDGGHLAGLCGWLIDEILNARRLKGGD